MDEAVVRSYGLPMPTDIDEIQLGDNSTSGMPSLVVC